MEGKKHRGTNDNNDDSANVKCWMNILLEGSQFQWQLWHSVNDIDDSNKNSSDLGWWRGALFFCLFFHCIFFSNIISDKNPLQTLGDGGEPRWGAGSKGPGGSCNVCRSFSSICLMSFCLLSLSIVYLFIICIFVLSGLGLGPGNGLGLTERDNEEIDSHRHLYVGFHVPKAKRTSEGGKHHHHHGSGKNKHGSLKPPVQNLRPGEERLFSRESSLKGYHGKRKFMESIH